MSAVAVVDSTKYLDDVFAGDIPPLQTFVDLGFTRWGMDFDMHRARYPFVAKYGFAIPCREAIDEIVKHGPILEVGAGTGFWASCVARRGVDIIATDAGFKDYAFDVGSHFLVVEALANEALASYGTGRAILMVWPTLSDPWCEGVLDRMTPGQVLIHVGELHDCTGTETFAERVEDTTQFECIAHVDIPVWPGIHDSMHVFRKCPPLQLEKIDEP